MRLSSDPLLRTANGRVKVLAQHLARKEATATDDNQSAAISVPSLNERPSEENTDNSGPLHGIKVLDLSQMVSGPMGTQILADMGADVIKVESLSGAAERRSAHDRVTSPLFAMVNRNKRALCLDLKRSEGLDAFFKLLKTADVLVHNFRPGVTDRMGIGYDKVRSVNPQIIYMSISGFGQSGPYSKKRVYDPVIQAVSGLASVQADETGRPRMMRLIVPDKVTALTSAQAITAALVQRSRTGVGTHIELAMLDAVVAFSWAEAFAQETFIDGSKPDYSWSRDMVFMTKDGYITCGAVQDKEWKALCAALDKPEWLSDPRFATAAARSLNRGERFEATEQALSKLTTAEAVARLTAHQVPNAVVNHPRSKVLADPQVLHNDLVQTVNHPWTPFPIRQPRPAARFSSAPYKLRHHAPLLGEHTHQVLAEVGVDAVKLEAVGAAKSVSGRKPEAKVRDSRLFKVSSA